MVLPKKVSRKLRKTNKNVKKNNKTGKKLKGGSGRVKSDKRRTTTEEKIAGLGNNARKNMKQQNELGKIIENIYMK